ncbi:MAG: hypothetical protein HKN87_09435 [Saprospiraceae bacterium]|nr:hypothetical protein [Saprospiraceae bacterium]
MDSRCFQFLFLLLLVSACNKVDVPEPEQDAPVFFSQLDLGGSPISFAAGQDNYTMDASFQRDSGVIEFVGVLRPKDCSIRLCPGSLRIGLRHTSRDNGAGAVGSSLRPKSMQYAYRFDRDSVRVKFSIVPVITDVAQSVAWSINGETVGSGHLIEKVLLRDRDYEVGIQTKRRGCNSRQIQTVRLPNGGCRSRIKVNEDRTLSVQSNGVPPLQHNWMNQSKDSVFHLSNLSSAERHNIWVRVTDANGCVSESEIGFDPSNRNMNCIADFGYKAERIINRDHFQLGKVTIDYIDDSGVIFTSNFLKQPADSYFEILTAEDFEANAAGQPTKKLHMEFLTTLFSEYGDQSIQLEGKTVFAVAYPKQ